MACMPDTPLMQLTTVRPAFTCQRSTQANRGPCGPLAFTCRPYSCELHGGERIRHEESAHPALLTLTLLLSGRLSRQQPPWRAAAPLVPLRPCSSRKRGPTGSSGSSPASHGPWMVLMTMMAPPRA